MSTAITSRPRYVYRVVTHNGAGVLGPDTTIAKAKAYLVTLVGTEFHETVEIERVLHLPNNARRYWLWRGGRWVPWGQGRTHEPTSENLTRWQGAVSSGSKGEPS